MISTILVPLDCSPLSEHALPLAVSIARRAGAALQLVHIHTPNTHPVGLSPTSGAEYFYLNAIAARLRPVTKSSVCIEVLGGSVVETLCQVAGAMKADLIVMTTHGRGPLSRFWLGSCAEELLRHGPAPILVQRPADEVPPQADQDVRLQRFLLPLDGSAAAESVLRPAVEIARLMQASLTLFRVVEPKTIPALDGQYHEAGTLEDESLVEMKHEARTYLDRLAEQLRHEGSDVATRVVTDNRVGGAILEESRQYDLVALTTHSRSALSQLVLGSVADKVVRGFAGPVLIVRPEPQVTKK
jgi:nucleotide-binding universal stress UspA family protein